MTDLPIQRGNPFKQDSLVAALQKALTTIEKVDRLSDGEDGRPEWRLYGTDAAYCPRKAALYNAAPRRHVTKATGKFYMASGKAAEEVIIDGFYKMGRLIYKDYRIPEGGVNIGGKVDLVFQWEGKVWGGEVKECGKLPDAIKPEHAPQAGAYSVITGLPFKLIYISRDAEKPGTRGDLNMRILDLDTSPEEIAKYARRIATSYVYSKAKLLPPKPTWIVKTKHCTYCAFQQMCWGTEPFPVSLPEPKLEAEMEKEIDALTESLLAGRANRRTGVLKFFMENGNEHARKFLSGADWSAI